MVHTTKLAQTGKTYYAMQNYSVPLTIAWRWIDRNIARYVSLRADVDAMPYYGIRVQQDDWRRYDVDKSQYEGQ